MRGEQADRARAEDDHGVPRADAGQHRPVVPGREDVRQHGEITLELGAGGQPEQVEVRERHPQVLGLATLVGAHLRVAVRGPVHPLGGVHPQAERGPAVHAVAAAPAGDIERHGHPVARLDPGHPGAGLLDDAHVLVAEDLALFHVRPALVHMQVRPADVGGGDPHHRVVGGFDPRVRDVLDRDFEWSFVHDGLHTTSWKLLMSSPAWPRFPGQAVTRPLPPLTGLKHTASASPATAAAAPGPRSWNLPPP